MISPTRLSGFTGIVSWLLKKSVKAGGAVEIIPTFKSFNAEVTNLAVGVCVWSLSSLFEV